jgi:hypothetical membrane protein
MTPGRPRSSTSSPGSHRSARLITVAGIAPIVLIGGWTLAASLQPARYSQSSQTISALAARGAHDRLVMTAALALLGLCYLATSVGVRAAALPGRLALALGGLATVAVAAFPQPRHGSAAAHVISATIGFVALALWPALAGRGDGWFALSRRTSIAASLVLLALLGWFGVALGGHDVGLAERFLAGAQSLWPVVVAVSNCRTPAPQ